MKTLNLKGTSFLFHFAFLSNLDAHYSVIPAGQDVYQGDVCRLTHASLPYTPPCLSSLLSSNTCPLIPTSRFAGPDLCSGLSDPCMILYTLDIHTPNRIDSFGSRSFQLQSPFLLAPLHTPVLPG